MAKGKLLISGEISDREIREISTEFSSDGFQIGKYTGQASIASIHDIVNLLFDDLHPMSFVRDYAIAKFIDMSYLAIKRVIGKLREKEKVINELTILKSYYKVDGTVVIMNFSCRIDKLNVLKGKLNDSLSYDFIESIAGGKTIYISLDFNDEILIRIL